MIDKRVLGSIVALFFVLVLVAYARRSPVHVVHSEGRRLETHYSPEENLEQIDVATIQDAHASVELFGYSLTDVRVISALETAAQKGSIECVYLDREQTEDELRRPVLRAALLRLASTPNVTILVKQSRILQHTKAYVIDTRLLREGSANFSRSALVQQDNDLVLTDDGDAIRRFEMSFQQAWQRRDNIRFADFAANQ